MADPRVPKQTKRVSGGSVGSVESENGALAHNGSSQTNGSTTHVSEKNGSLNNLSFETARFRQIIDSCRDAYVEVDLDNMVTEWSAQAEAMLGWSREEMLGRSILDVIATQDLDERVNGDVDALRSASTAARSSLLGQVLSEAGVESVPTASTNPSARAVEDHPEMVTVEMEMLHRDGSVVLARGNVFVTGAGEGTRIAGFVEDVARERSRVQDALASDRLHDSLTGLPARALFMRRVAIGVEALKSGSGSVAVMVLDIDRFKAINDSMGHEAGDALLVSVVSRLKAAGEQNGPVLARLGGDEFLAFFHSETPTARTDAEEFAEKALSVLADPFEVEDTEVFLSASVGIATSTGPEVTASMLLSNADAAMHETKTEGGGSFKVFGEAMRWEVVHRMNTEHSLHRALDRRELKLFYQPVVGISGSETMGVEALIRWEHPEQGLVFPDRFIPVAEESGLIIPIGAWVLQEACEQLTNWRHGGYSGPTGTVEVNLSARQIDHPDLVRTVESILNLTGLPPENLTLEITESALMKDAVSALAVLQALKDIGVALAIDDFGTGYSSLSYLQRFPLDILKVDKSFVDELEVDQGTEIVAAIINLAHALGLEVVAEGVETTPQLDCLRQLGCDYAQGYLFSKPVPASELSDRFALGA